MEPLAGRKSLADQVHDRLVDAMCSGALPPGTPLRQERLAEELNVSRQPVLQALGLLRRDGLLEPMGRRGYRVAPVDAALVRHVYDLRAAFDGLAARLAAQAPLHARIATLDRIANQGKTALVSGQTTDLVAADVAFHQGIYLLSGNPLVSDASAAVWLQVRRVMHVDLDTPDSRNIVWSEHDGIADAIRAGDAALAETRAGAHARNATARLLDRIGEVQNP